MPHDDELGVGQTPSTSMPKQGSPPQDLKSLKNVVLGVYILQAASLMIGITLIIGVVLNYVRITAAQGTWLASHFQWQINTFWWFLLWFVLGALTLPLGVGYAIVLGAVAWLIFRFAKGWMALNANQPVTATPLLRQ